MTKVKHLKRFHFLKEDFITVDRNKIHYLRVGKGFPVFLIHSFAGSLRHWAFNIHALSRHFQVIAVDMPGYGESGRHTQEFSTELFSRTIVRIMDKLGIEKAHLIGSSLGGQVALITAVEYPERVQKLVLVDSAGAIPIPYVLRMPLMFLIYLFGPALIFFRPGSLLVKLIIDFSFYRPSPLTRRFAKDVARYFRSVDYAHWSQILYKTVAGVVEKNLRHRVSLVEAETFIIWGKQDRVLWPFQGRYLHKNIKNSKLVMVDQCGHFPHIEKPQEFNQLVTSFLLDKKLHSSAQQPGMRLVRFTDASAKRATSA